MEQKDLDEGRRSSAAPRPSTAPSVDRLLREQRARMFLLGWFGAALDAEETEEMIDLLSSFAQHEIEALTRRSTLATILDRDTAADTGAVGIWFETPRDAEAFLSALVPQTGPASDRTASNTDPSPANPTEEL